MNTFIYIVAIGAIAGIIVIMGLYYFNYKKSINQTLKEDKEPSRNVLRLPSLIEVAALLLSIAIIINSFNAISMYNSLNSQINTLTSEINNLKALILMYESEDDKKEDYDFDIFLVDYDLENWTGNFVLTVQLSDITKDTQVYICYGNSEVEAQQGAGGKFSISETLNLNDNYGEVRIKIIEGDSISYKDTGETLNDLQNRVANNFFTNTDFNFEVSEKNGIHINGTILVNKWSKYEYNQYNPSLTKIVLSFESNGKVLQSSILDEGSDLISLDQEVSYPIKDIKIADYSKDISIKGYLTVNDSQGLQYKVLLFEYTNEEIAIIDELCSITTANGKVYNILG